MVLERRPAAGIEGYIELLVRVGANDVKVGVLVDVADLDIVHLSAARRDGLEEGAPRGRVEASHLVEEDVEPAVERAAEYVHVAVAVDIAYRDACHPAAGAGLYLGGAAEKAGASLVQQVIEVAVSARCDNVKPHLVVYVAERD